MRYLEISSLEIINNAFGNLEITNGSRISGRVEAYSCKEFQTKTITVINFEFYSGKPTSSDRKILKKLNEDSVAIIEDISLITEELDMHLPEEAITKIEDGRSQLLARPIKDSDVSLQSIRL